MQTNNSINTFSSLILACFERGEYLPRRYFFSQISHFPIKLDLAASARASLFGSKARQ